MTGPLPSTGSWSFLTLETQQRMCAIPFLGLGDSEIGATMQYDCIRFSMLGPVAGEWRITVNEA